MKKYHLEAGRLAAKQHEHHLLLYRVDQPHLVRRRDGARVSETVYQPGDLGCSRAANQELAVAKSITVAQLNIAWLLHQSDWILLILGTTSRQHLEENVQAADSSLSPEELAF